MHNEIIKLHQKFLVKMLPILTLVGVFMTLISIYIQDSETVILNNIVYSGMYFIIFFVLKYHDGDQYHEKRVFYLIMGATLTIMLWGANMLGYEKNQLVGVMDYVIAILVGSVVVPLNIKSYLPLMIMTNIYLFFFTPYFDRAVGFQLLEVATILFSLVCVFLAHLSYMRMVNSVEAHLSLKRQSEGLEELVKEKSEALKQKEDLLSKEVVGVLSTIIEYYDAYTMGHSHNVAGLSEKLASRMGGDLEFRQEVYWAGLIHDIGKIRIAKDLLNKPGPLTDDEYRVLQQHSKYGYEMLKESEVLHKIGKIILHHHERFDGKGYPAKLKDKEIPLAAQIICLVDAWDAMRSERIYRPAFSVQRARDEIKKNRGTQFAPDVVDVFLSLEESHK